MYGEFSQNILKFIITPSKKSRRWWYVISNTINWWLIFFQINTTPILPASQPHTKLKNKFFLFFYFLPKFNSFRIQKQNKTVRWFTKIILKDLLNFICNVKNIRKKWTNMFCVYMMKMNKCMYSKGHVREYTVNRRLQLILYVYISAIWWW